MSKTEHTHQMHLSKLYPLSARGKPTIWADIPPTICSARCKLIDLAWANEDYKVSAEDTPFSDELDAFK